MSQGVPIGLKDVHYCLLLTDPVDGTATYGPAKRLVGAITANVNPNASNDTLFADDGPFDTASTVGQISLELGLANISLEDQAILNGHTLEGGILKRKSSDVPPFVAVGFRSLKSNGKYRFTWLNKGKFTIAEQNNQTKGDSISWNTPTMSGSFVKRDSDDEWERHTDEDAEDFIPSVATNWFTSPLSNVPTSPLAISSTLPTAGATGVAVNSPVVVTFNNMLTVSTVTAASVTLRQGATTIPAQLTVDGTRKILTVTPDAALTADTSYVLTITPAVKDINNSGLSANFTLTFTTAT